MENNDSTVSVFNKFPGRCRLKSSVLRASCPAGSYLVFGTRNLERYNNAIFGRENTEGWKVSRENVYCFSYFNNFLHFCAKRLLRPCEPQSTTCPSAYASVRNPTNAHENYLSAFWTLWAGGSLKKSQMVQKGDPHKQRLAKHTGILRDPLFSSFFWFFEKSFL